MSSLQEKLRQLYTLDQQLRGLKTRLDAAGARHAAQKTRLERFEQQQAELAEQLKVDQAKAASLEKQAGEAEQRVSHLRDQMNTVKNNKEYSALLVEVNTLKLEKSKLEDEALEQLGRVEALKKDLEAMKERVAAQKKIVAAAAQEVEACRGQIGDQLDEVTARHREAEEAVPIESREVFYRQVEVHEGEAMAAVVEVSRRHMEYSCGGCFRAIPVERVNALMVNPEKIVSCPNCGRILDLDADLKSSIGCK